jgi:hypothetical protein
MEDIEWENVWDRLTNRTYVGLPPKTDHGERMQAINEKLKESEAAVHEAEVDASWWSGLISGVIFMVAGFVLMLILRSLL